MRTIAEDVAGKGNDCEKRVKVTEGIGAGGTYRCTRKHDASCSFGAYGNDFHEAMLGWGGAVVRWDEADWSSPPTVKFERLN